MKGQAVIESHGSTNAAVQKAFASDEVSREHINSNLDSISRYLPTDPTAFLVEEHRLNPTEKLSQRVTSVTPWLLFGAFACSPFFVMKYNLDKLSASSDGADPEDALRKKSIGRIPFRHCTYADMPEILERRYSTFVGIYSDNFQSHMAVLVYKELDRLLAKYMIACSVCVFDLDTADSAFRQQYPLAPVGQLVQPGNELTDYTGLWNLRGMIEFIARPSQITDGLLRDIAESDAKLNRVQGCLFRRRFAEQDKSRTVADSLNSASLDSILDRCESAA